MNKSITFVTMSLDVGGTERHLITVLPALKALGYEIQVWLLIRKGILAEALEKNGIPVQLILPESGFIAKMLKYCPGLLRRPLRFFLATFYLFQNIRRNKNQLSMLHFFLPEPYIVGMIAAKLAKFKGVLLMSRRSVNRYQQNHWGSRFLEKWCHPKTELILGNCQVILDELKDEGVASEKLRLIYNGIDLKPFLHAKNKNEMRASLGIKGEDLVFIMVANFLPYKGHHDLLTSLAAIHEKLPISWKLILVGRDANLEASLKQYAEEKNLQSHILWLGIRKDIPDLLNASDIGILCSHEEGFANAIIEGMAASLPMIVTDVGGNKEAVIDGETGLVLNAKDINGLSQAILKLAQNLEYARALGKKARLRVESEFSFQASVLAYDKMYQSLKSFPDILSKTPCFSKEYH